MPEHTRVQDVQACIEADGAAGGSVQLLHPAEPGVRVLATFHKSSSRKPQAIGPGDYDTTGQYSKAVLALHG
jgi:hypothetical protein